VTSSAWLSNDIASRPTLPRQRHHQLDLAVTSHHGQVASMIPCWHDSTATSRRCQHWLSNAITSMTRGLGAYFLNHPSDSEVYYRSCSRAWGVPLQSKTWLGYTTTNASPILNRGERIITNKIMGHFIKPAKSYSQHYVINMLVNQLIVSY
jgi:hypothetical protein